MCRRAAHNFAERARDGIDRDPDRYFRRRNSAEPERGKTGKDRYLSTQRFVWDIRHEGAETAYDTLDNIQARTLNGAANLTYSYASSTNRLSSVSNGQTFSYNAEGDYDGNSKRIKKISGGVTEYELYDHAGQMVYTDNGSVLTDYISLGGKVIVEMSKSGSTTTPEYLLPDLLGSPHEATTQDASIKYQMEWNPYGRELNGVAQ